MAQIHYVAAEDNKGTTMKSACGKWYRQGMYIGGRYYQNTADASKVTCPKCAAKLGVATAPVAAPKHAAGTCACCFRNQQVKPSGSMFKHGYQRPGHGYILGGCPGDGFAPYEVSCKGTEYMLGLATAHLSALRENLVKLQAATTVSKSIEYECRREERPGFNFGRNKYLRKTELASVTQEEGHRVHTAPDGMTHWLDFSNIKNFQVSQVERNIHGVEQDIAFLTRKVAEWKKVA